MSNSDIIYEHADVFKCLPDEMPYEYCDRFDIVLRKSYPCSHYEEYVLAFDAHNKMSYIVVSAYKIPNGLH